MQGIGFTGAVPPGDPTGDPGVELLTEQAQEVTGGSGFLCEQLARVVASESVYETLNRLIGEARRGVLRPDIRGDCVRGWGGGRGG